MERTTSARRSVQWSMGEGEAAEAEEAAVSGKLERSWVKAADCL